ncbi:MAG: alpha/beta hydrolase [Betaproteobacteria bacterium]|nr:alpha/beta hydrolase [Betaproteobacteria bacterium]MDH5221988.1 alpha/beta hydrolase [Betaproteobacteria bacterium]MDH5349750.1 alpha/beta hydrolase [Betaproteobacteria bacterium]
MRDVVLAHGLWVPAVVMTPLAARLAQAGFRCHLFSYHGRERPLDAHAERLARFAREVGPAHFVGHSLGGLVVLHALEQHRLVAAGNVLLLGSPVRGNFAGRRLAQHGWGRWFLGASESLWREGRAAHWTRPEPLGVLAGTTPVGLGRLFGALPGANDGVVRVEETEVDGMRERIVLPVAHSTMLVSARVAAQAVSFLKDARFLPRR